MLSSWLECKFTCLFLSSIIEALPLSGTEAFPSREVLSSIGYSVLFSLLSIKHLGAIVYISNSFETITKKCFMNNTQDTTINKYIDMVFSRFFSLPLQWLDLLVTGSIYNNKVYVLRRSSGCIQAIQSVCFFHQIIKH